MQIINIMGMTFEVGREPNFGSIRRTISRYNNRNEYLLKFEDVEKLNLLVQYNGAYDGSTAYCSDTADLYLLHMGEWIKVGDSDD